MENNKLKGEGKCRSKRRSAEDSRIPLIVISVNLYSFVMGNRAVGFAYFSPLFI